MNTRGQYGNGSRRASVGTAVTIDIAPNATAVDMFRAQKKAFTDKLGSDSVMPPAGHGFGAFAMDIPRTTNGDVLQLAKYWTGKLKESGEAFHGIAPLSRDATVAQWKIATDNIDRVAKSSKANDTYQNNNEFWRSASEVSMLVDVTNAAPTKLAMANESLKYGVTHLPETLKAVAEKAGSDVWTLVKYGVYGVLAIGTVIAISSVAGNMKSRETRR